MIRAMDLSFAIVKVANGVFIPIVVEFIGMRKPVSLPIRVSGCPSLSS